jgi:acetoin utilization deacetylase AcuC-like enzyme
MRTAYISHPDCLKHDTGDHHPECAERLQAIDDRLIAAGLMDLMVCRDAPKVAREELERVHDAAYLDAVDRAMPGPGDEPVHLDPDTIMSGYSYDAALRAAGAVVHATRMVLSGEVADAFCAIRPPGHHAERACAMGFCVYNNIAVGAAEALEVHGLERVALVDFDVHHGNGGEDIFRDDPRVMVCSSFQHPFYPNRPFLEEDDRIICCPLEAGSGSEAFREAIQRRWLPALEAFKPQMIFISAGFDAHRADPMAQLRFTEADYRWVTQQLVKLAQRHAEGRIVSSLEGGYEPTALALSVEAHLRVLMQID